jgi:hypothetical protein
MTLAEIRAQGKVTVYYCVYSNLYFAEHGGDVYELARECQKLTPRIAEELYPELEAVELTPEEMAHKQPDAFEQLQALIAA